MYPATLKAQVLSPCDDEVISLSQMGIPQWLRSRRMTASGLNSMSRNSGIAKSDGLSSVDELSVFFPKRDLMNRNIYTEDQLRIN